MKRLFALLAAAVALLVAALAFAIWVNEYEEPDAALIADIAGVAATPEQVARGAYLARAGNCLGCHSARGGQAYAGGRELRTPFGIFVTPNITPDAETGIGHWTAEDFWRAMHHGRGLDGRPLYPAFPYTEYTKVTREDSDAIFAFLRSLAPVARRAAPDRLDFPYDQRPLLYVWRALYFKPGTYQAAAAQSEEWNRGAYLVQGLGHCNACHATRNALGAAGGAALGGGQVAGRNWYAPSLTSRAEAGSGDRSIDEAARLLATGISDQGAAAGPMAEVIAQSLQHLTPADLRAMAVYLKSLPDSSSPAAAPPDALSADAQHHVDSGGKIYEKHCKDCHGASGEGAPGAYPALAGNAGVTLPSPLNTIRSVLDGGFVPSTHANPRPYGMPPFAQALTNQEVAQVVSYVRNAWGNRASLVTAIDVDKSGSD